MAKGLQSLTELDGFPIGLDWLYFDSLRRVVDLGKRDWFNEYRPLMGVLSVAQESLTLAQIQSFTNQSESSCMEYRRNLEQFIEEVKPQGEKGEQVTKYRLYHQSVMDFLHSKVISIKEKGGERELDNTFYLPADEWHRHMANVCEQDNLSIIWDDIKRDQVKQGRRQYARHYYVTHLYQAQEWQRLFEVLDSVQYGRAKIRFDPSTHSYARDVELGRLAAAWDGWTTEEGIEQLAHLWQYTLLQCSLTSRANQYPPIAFGLLVVLKRKQEAVELAELLTDPARKVTALLQIARQLREQSGQGTEWLEVLMRAGEVVRRIEGSDERAWALSELATALAQAQQWEQAEAVIGRIEGSDKRAWALRELATALAQAQQWEQAEVVIGRIEGSDERAWVLSGLGTALAQAQRWERAEAVWTEAEAVIGRIKRSDARARALRVLATALAHAQRWERAEAAWTEAEAVIGKMEESYVRAEALRALGTALAHAQRWERAEAVIGKMEESYVRTEALRALGTALAHAQRWEQAEAVIGKMEESDARARALSALATALAHAQRWEQAEAVIDRIKESYVRAEALHALATALAHAQRWEQAEVVIDRIIASFWRAEALRELPIKIVAAGEYKQLLQWIQHFWWLAKTREDAFQLFPMATWFIPQYPELGIAFYKAFTWVDTFLRG